MHNGVIDPSLLQCHRTHHCPCLTDGEKLRNERALWLRGAGSVSSTSASLLKEGGSLCSLTGEEGEAFGSLAERHSRARAPRSCNLYIYILLVWYLHRHGVRMLFYCTQRPDLALLVTIQGYRELLLYLTGHSFNRLFELIDAFVFPCRPAWEHKYNFAFCFIHGVNVCLKIKGRNQR